MAQSTTTSDTAKPSGSGSLPRISDTLPRTPDSLRRLADSGRLLARADTLPLSDSAKHALDSLRSRDSLRHRTDSARLVSRTDSARRAADTVLSAAAMLRQIDSLNASHTGVVDSVKLRLDAMLAASTQRTNGPPNANQRVNPGYSPSAGSLLPPGSSGNPGMTSPGSPSAGNAAQVNVPSALRPSQIKDRPRRTRRSN